jgi:hypothetical protein
MPGNLAIGLSTALLILLPVAGTIGTGYAAIQWVKSGGPHCGMWWMAQFMITAIAGFLGLAAGVGAGWLSTVGIFRWANGCGLGEIRDDGTLEL